MPKRVVYECDFCTGSDGPKPKLISTTENADEFYKTEYSIDFHHGSDGKEDVYCCEKCALQIITAEGHRRFDR